jgi:glycosyltransferase involved in cell wall biosynthesis
VSATPAAGRRVLLVVEQLRRRVPGGIGTTIRGLLQGLDELGADAPTVTLAASRVRGSDPLARFGHAVRTWPLPDKLLTRAWSAGLAPPPSGFGVVHATSLAAPPVRGRTASAALVVTIADLAWRTYPDETTARGRRWHEAALRRAMRHADAAVVPSRPVAQALAEAGMASDRITIVPWGSDHLAPPDDAGAAALLRGLDIGGEFLLALGTLEPRKNLGRLVAAYARARAEGLGPVPLLVVGPSGWGASGLPDPAPEGVVLAGSVSEGVKSALLRDAAAAVYVPLLEGFGLPPLEAMACGTPVLASSAVPSVAPDGDVPCAVIVDPLDVDAIAHGLLALRDDALRDRLSAAGLEHARTLTWAAVARRHVELWSALR